MTRWAQVEEVAIRLAAWERRLRGWRTRAQQLLLARELGPRGQFGAGLNIEPGVSWRIGSMGRLLFGEGCTVRTGAELKVDGALRVGRGVLIGAWSTISVLDEVEIGDDCLLAERVSVRDHDHCYEDPDTPISEQGYRVERVRIGRNVWLGAGVTVMRGVELGDHCVVGANAVVTRSFPAGCVLAGVPARVLRRLEPPVTPDGRAP